MDGQATLLPSPEPPALLDPVEDEPDDEPDDEPVAESPPLELLLSLFALAGDDEDDDEEDDLRLSVL